MFSFQRKGFAILFIFCYENPKCLLNTVIYSIFWLIQIGIKYIMKLTEVFVLYYWNSYIRNE